MSIWSFKKKKKKFILLPPVTLSPNSIPNELHTSNNNNRSFLGGNLPFDMILATILLVGMFLKHFSKLTSRALKAQAPS